MIPNSLKTYRKIKGLSQSRLSQISHVPQTTISGWETGLPEDHAVYRAIHIAHALDTDVEKLFAPQHELREQTAKAAPEDGSTQKTK